MSKHLILGGARSGKSRYAEEQALLLAEKNHLTCWYIATATANDNEMQQRIERHQQDRDQRWQLIEEPLDVARVINTYNHDNDCLLIDCLTLWLSNVLMEEKLPHRKTDFINALCETKASVFIVSNEVGSGIVPLGELSRQFVDESGWLHQELAAICNHVTLVVAGLPMVLK